MKNHLRKTVLALCLAAFVMVLFGASISMAARKADIDRNDRRVLTGLLRKNLWGRPF